MENLEQIFILIINFIQYMIRNTHLNNILHE